jgi:hypothetical protein
MDVKRLENLSPPEFDTELAGHYAAAERARSAVHAAQERVFYAAGARRSYGRGPARWSQSFADAFAACEAMAADENQPGYKRSDAVKAIEGVAAARAAENAARNVVTAYNEVFHARGGWTRGFLVTDGHVHSSMSCSTCNRGEFATQFTWLTEFSGHTEAEVVEAAADRACTVCYPSAPVETAGPSRLMTPEEQTRAEQREAAAKAKAERDAAKIAKGLTADGSEFVVSYAENWPVHVPQGDGTSRSHMAPRERTERFKTERAASNWVMQYGTWDNGLDGEKAVAFTAIIDAIAAKHHRDPAEVRAEFETKIAKKRKKEG